MEEAFVGFCDVLGGSGGLEGSWGAGVATLLVLQLQRTISEKGLFPFQKSCATSCLNLSIKSTSNCS